MSDLDDVETMKYYIGLPDSRVKGGALQPDAGSRNTNNALIWSCENVYVIVLAIMCGVEL